MANEKDCTPEQERENRFKAIELNIESLKQYITLSTVSIAGLLAYYSSTKESDTTFLFISIGLFVICAIISIFNINLFINKVHKNKIDVRAGDARKANFIAIGFFLLAIVSATFFFFNSNHTQNNSSMENSTIKLNDYNIEIGKDVKTKVEIRTDTTKNHIEILINK
jgi:hypothetical protein